jgi:hypothetical protein
MKARFSIKILAGEPEIIFQLFPIFTIPFYRLIIPKRLRLPTPYFSVLFGTDGSWRTKVIRKGVKSLY